MIVIGADFVPTKENTDAFVRGDAEGFLGPELQRTLQEADYRIFNLEVPLTDTAAPIAKCGPNLIAPSDAVNGYRAVKADLLTLANNHILDHGAQGLQNTIRHLDVNGIHHVGAGDTPQEASKPFRFSCFGKTIGVYACAEHEFSIVTARQPGANPFDPLYSLDHISELKQACDYVIVLYHGGKEYYRYPSPQLQRTCRRLIEKGADLVLCQHTHCIGCEERYQGGVIVYGQGNFLFGRKKEPDCWNESLLVLLNEKLEVSYLAVEVSADGARANLAAPEKAEQLLRDFAERSADIRRDGFLNEAYIMLAEEKKDAYFRTVTGRENRVFDKANQLLQNRLRERRVRRRYGEKGLLALQNYLECEAHRELLLACIELRKKQI